MFTPCCQPPDDCGQECCTLSEEMVRTRECFRLLWEQHVYWTRLVILGIVFDTPDLEASTARLLRNADDFARAFRYYYGRQPGEEMGRLVKDHLVIAAELARAAKAGDRAKAADAEKRWYANADEIVAFLHRLNPCWSVRHMRAMWHKHLEMTKNQALAFLAQKFEDSVAIFDRVEYEALQMADEMAEGIICQCGMHCL